MASTYVDMYNPANGAHYLASTSQLRVLAKSGWVRYADWLAEQPVEPVSEPAPEPAPIPSPTPSTEETSPVDTVPAPTL